MTNQMQPSTNDLMVTA